MFTRSTNIITDPDIGKSILFKGDYKASNQTATWSVFPFYSIKKTDPTIIATDGQTVNIICPLKSGDEPWNIIPAILTVKPAECIARVQVDLN